VGNGVKRSFKFFSNLVSEGHYIINEIVSLNGQILTRNIDYTIEHYSDMSEINYDISLEDGGIFTPTTSDIINIFAIVNLSLNP